MSDQDTVGKMADAAKSFSELGIKVADAATSFGGIFKGPITELIGCVEDKFKYVRWERRQALILKAETFMKQRSLPAPTRVLPLPFAVPLLTHAILEEDDELQETWAKLLVNAGDASTPIELRTAYVEILAGMSAFDVKNLSLMARESLSAQEKSYLPIIETWNLPASAKVHEEASQDTGFISKELGISLGNLNRLGCAAPSYGWGGIAIFQLMTVTHLGRALYLACS